MKVVKALIKLEMEVEIAEGGDPAEAVVAARNGALLALSQARYVRVCRSRRWVEDPAGLTPHGAEGPPTAAYGRN